MKLVNSRGPLSDFEVWNVTKQVVVSTHLADNESWLLYWSKACSF